MNEDPYDQEWLSKLFGEQEKRLMIKGISKRDGEDLSSISTEDVSRFIKITSLNFLVFLAKTRFADASHMLVVLRWFGSNFIHISLC